MHHHTSQRSPSAASQALSSVLREAKRLQRAACAEELALSLPVLRRMLSSQTLQRMTLPELRRQRGIIQRKHILRMLACEAGFANWEAYRHALQDMHTSELAHFDMARHEAGHLNLWFSTLAEAKTYAATHGGRVMQVGVQAVVLINA